MDSRVHAIVHGLFVWAQITLAQGIRHVCVDWVGVKQRDFCVCIRVVRAVVIALS